MSQSDGANNIKRMEFEFDGKSYKFILNPEEYTMSEPNRINVTQAKAGAWSDEFGAGIKTIQFKGTTGFRNHTGDPTSGYKKFIQLRDTIRSVYDRVAPGTVIPSSKEMVFHNYTDEEHWIVSPKMFEVNRSVARPLMFVYSIVLVCMRPADTPNPLDTDALDTNNYEVIRDRRISQ